MSQDDKKIVTSVLSQAFPTALLKLTLTASVGVPLLAIELSGSEWVQALVAPLQSATQITSVLILIMLLALSLFAVFQYALLCRHTINHVTIIHQSSYYPLLSVKWLVKNLKATHYIAIFFILLITFYGGYIVGKI